MKNKIIAWIPIFASAKFECEKPAGWSKWSHEKKWDYFMNNSHPDGGLCHQCTDGIYTDIEYDIDMDPKDIEFHEAKD